MAKFLVEVQCSMPVRFTKEIEAPNRSIAENKFRDLCEHWHSVMPYLLPDCEPEDYPKLFSHERHLEVYVEELDTEEATPPGDIL